MEPKKLTMTMKPDKDIFTINGVQERDIDLLLLEEFGSSSNFCTFFLEATGHSSELTLEKAEVSVTGTDGRESDLVVWFKENDRTWVFLIENKINAPMQEKQVEDYLKRGKNYVDEGKADDYRVVLSAAKGYIEEHQSEAEKFHHTIRYEQVAEWIDRSDIPAARKTYKSALIRTAIEKQGEKGDWGVKNESETVTKFWHDYWKLVSEIAPEFGMQKPGKMGSGSDWYEFTKAEGLPDAAKFIHKTHKSYFDLQFGGTSPEELKERYGNKVQEGVRNGSIHDSARIEQAEKSASIRVSVPKLDIKSDLEQQEEDCITAVRRGRELLKFFDER